MDERTERLPSRQAVIALVFAAALVDGLSCGGDDVMVPTTGSLALTTSTSGADPDADGYVVNIDDGPGTAIPATGNLQREDLEQGNHSVQLSGIDANCIVMGENPRTVTVSAGETATVTFELLCSATTGNVRITSSTTGPSPDGDGYTLTVDGAQRGTLAATGAASLDGLTPTTHAVGLGNVAENCQVDGDNPRSIIIAAGETAEVSFAIACTATTGDLGITTFTTGDSPDPDGYTIAVDGAGMQPAAINAVVSITGIPIGHHTVTLAGLAANCTAAGENPRDVVVTSGHATVTTFAVTCPQAGGKIAFESERDGNGEIYVMNPDGTEQTRLTHNPGRDYDAAWSPDETKIAFTSVRDGTTNIYVMNSDGSGVVRLTNSGIPTDGRPEHSANPTWSPDGSKIAFQSSRDRRYGIWIMNSDGSGVTQITSDGGGPAWSPDGKKIALQVATAHAADTDVMNLDGTNRVTIYYTFVDCTDQIDWSPDGSRVALDDCYDLGIRVVKADGSEKIRISPAIGQVEYHPTWSPDGSKIAFTRSPDDRSALSDIYVMNSDGTGVTRLTDNPAADAYPAWSR